MGVVPPAIVRSNPQNDLTPFCAHLWETDTEMCKDVFDDEIPRPQPGSTTTTKAEDDAYVERFFDRDTILINGYRFLKMALIAISQYNHTQIVNCANEYFDNDKTNQELFQDAGTAQQMRTTTDITSFFDKKFIEDHNHQRFLTRVMQYIQCNFDHFKETYGTTDVSKVAMERVNATPAGSPGPSETTERARSADDGRVTPTSEADVGFPASLEVPKSRNSQTPIVSDRAPVPVQASANTHVEPVTQHDSDNTPSSHQRQISEEQPIGRGESPSSNQRDPEVLDVERKSSRDADSSSGRADPESTTPMHHHESRPSRELSAQRIKEFVPNQSRVHSSGSDRGYHTPGPRYEQMGHYAPTSAYNAPIHPAEHVAYNTDQPQRNDQQRQNNRGRGGYSNRGRGRGQWSGNLHVLDHNQYQRLPAETFQIPQNQAPFPPSAAERSENWRQKENGPPTMDAKRTFSDQPLSAPYGFGTDPMQQHLPFLPPGSGPMRYAVTDRTNNSGGIPYHSYGHMIPPSQERSVSDGSSLEGRREDHVTVSNVPNDASEDLVVKRVAEVLNLRPGQCKTVGRDQDQLFVETNPAAVWSLVVQQPRVVINGRKLRFEQPPRPPPAVREAMKRRYPNRDRSRHNTEQYSGHMAPMPPFDSMQRDTSFRPGFAFNTGPSQHQPGSLRGRPPVPDVYQPNVAFAGAERGWGFGESFAGQHPERPDQGRGPPPRDLPGPTAGPSGKKNRKSPKKNQSPDKNAQRSGSYNDTAWLKQTGTIVPENPLASAGAPDVVPQSKDALAQPRGEVDHGTLAGAVGHKKVISTSSIETVKQKDLHDPLPQSDATLPALPRTEQSDVLKARPADEPIAQEFLAVRDEPVAEEFLAGIQAAARQDGHRDTVHEAFAAPKTQSSNLSDGLVVQSTPKRDLTSREAGEDVDESFQTAHESPIEDKDDEGVPTTIIHKATTAEPSEISESKDIKPRKEQEMAAGTQAQDDVFQNKDNQPQHSEHRKASSRTVKKSDRPQELAVARPAKTESLSPFARQRKSKKKDEKPKPAKGKGKEEIPAGTQAQSGAMPATKQTQNGSSTAGQETASSAAKDKIARADEAIKVDDEPMQEQDKIRSGYISESERKSGDILLQASGIDSSVSESFTAHDASSTKLDPDDQMPFMDKGKGRMYPDQTATTATQIPVDTMPSNDEKGKGKMLFDPAPTFLTQEPPLPVSTVPDLEENFKDLDLTKEGDDAESRPCVQQRSVSQLSNVTESTQSMPGEKPKSKKKKKNKKKKAPTDATTAAEQSVGPADTTEDHGVTNEDDSEDGDKIFTPPGSSATDSAESKQGKTSRVASSGLLQAPRNTLQLRKQKQPVKPRKVADADNENEVDTSKAGQSSILSKLGAKFGTNVEVINLSTSKAPAKLRPESPPRSDTPVNESVRKMQELKHRENIAKLSREPDEEVREKAIRLENERHEKDVRLAKERHEEDLCLEKERFDKERSKREHDKLCKVDDSQATTGATDTATSSETVDYPQPSATEDNDNDRGLTPAQARFERDQEQERLRREEYEGKMASYYKAKEKDLGRQLDVDIWTAVNDPELLDRHSRGYRGPPPIPTHPNPPPNFRDKMESMHEFFGKPRDYPGPSHSWKDL
ncbi:hypothetical protein MBLNU457_3249t1 [Dothideomycetes sp. NU457]